MHFNISAIRKLLTSAFTDQQLRQICYDAPVFRPVYEILGQHSGKKEIVHELIEYAERQLLVIQLLDIVKTQNPARYEMYEPYYWQSTEPQNSIVKVLFLAANPVDQPSLALEQESQRLHQVFREYPSSGLALMKQHATSVKELQKLLLENRPTIVHFSGHGNENSEILLENDNGQSQTVPFGALNQLFSLVQNDVNCVILNACYSAPQAQAIAMYIKCVIGISNVICDSSAVSFAESFYRAIALGRSVKDAFELGRNQIHLENLHDEEQPILIDPRNNAEKLKFVEDH